MSSMVHKLLGGDFVEAKEMEDLCILDCTFFGDWRAFGAVKQAGDGKFSGNGGSASLVATAHCVSDCVDGSLCAYGAWRCADLADRAITAAKSRTQFVRGAVGGKLLLEPDFL